MIILNSLPQLTSPEPGFVFCDSIAPENSLDLPPLLLPQLASPTLLPAYEFLVMLTWHVSERLSSIHCPLRFSLILE